MQSSKLVISILFPVIADCLPGLSSTWAGGSSRQEKAKSKPPTVEDEFTFIFPGKIAAQQGFQLDAEGVVTMSNISGKYWWYECCASTALSE